MDGMAAVCLPALAVAGLDLDVVIGEIRCERRGCSRFATTEVGVGKNHARHAHGWRLCEACARGIFYEPDRDDLGRRWTYGDRGRASWVDGEARTEHLSHARLDRLPRRRTTDDDDDDMLTDDPVARVTFTRLMLHLPYRSRVALELRYGIDGGPERTLDEIGRVFGVTKERVRQILLKAERWLTVEVEKITRHAPT